MRLGAGDDLALEDPDPAERGLIELLSGEQPLSRDDLTRELLGRGCSVGRLGDMLEALVQAEVLELRRYPDLLDPPIAERFSRQLIYFADLADPEIGPEPLQLRLRRSRVALVGCGGLGSWVACGLAGVGVGSLVLVDDDRVELSNLSRQLLFCEDQIGETKTAAAAATLRSHNSTLEVLEIERRISNVAEVDDLLDLEPDLVVATADWPPHELPRWINRACVRRGVPWIGAGQFPPRLRVGPMVLPGISPCLACLEAGVRRDYPLYDQLAEWRSRRELPDASVGPVCGVIGSLIASEAMHLLAGAFLPRSVGRALLLDLQSMELVKEPIAFEPGCEVCQTALRTALSDPRKHRPLRHIEEAPVCAPEEGRPE